MHLVVPRHGSTDVLSNSSDPTAGQQLWERRTLRGEHGHLQGRGQRPPFLFFAAFLSRDSNIPPWLGGRPFTQPEGKMLCSSFLPLLEEGVSTNQALPENQNQQDTGTLGGISSSRRTCSSLEDLATDWKRPTLMTEGNLLYSKSTDRRCEPHLQNTLTTAPSVVCNLMTRGVSLAKLTHHRQSQPVPERSKRHTRQCTRFLI